MGSGKGEMEARGRESGQIRRIALYGFLLNLGLAGVKFFASFLSNSLAVTASAIDSATDSVSSLILYIGLRLSFRKTSTFPLGRYKIDNLLSVVVALFIFYAGYEIIRRVFSPQAAPPEMSVTVVLLMAASTLATFLFGRYAVAAGRRTESPTLVAEGRHREVDSLSSVAVLLAVLLIYFDLEFAFYGVTIDQIAAVLVLLFIAHTGWDLLHSGMRVLLDASLDKDELSHVRQIIESEPLVADIRSLVGRKAGRFRFLQATITMRTDDLKKAHTITEDIESRIHENIPHVERVVIHYEPESGAYRRIALPLEDKKGELSLDPFGTSPFFLIARLHIPDGSIKEEEVVENPFRAGKRSSQVHIAEWLVSKNVDAVILAGKLRQKAPRYVFSSAGTRILTVSAKNRMEALDAAVASFQSA
ncbi:MAG: cation diffusion facilitator family transporter [Syntrophales bacterium]|jgi:cation diffusion facilitator family transporter|nr:cation diffusion facilitator family transporter [Syntrophales bacterium]MDY0044129.1 cation diffusion facilitator family transporter [Syntrophales bacterium]